MHPQREVVADGGLGFLVDDAARNYGKAGKAIGSAALEIDDDVHTVEEEKREEDLVEEVGLAEGAVGGELDGTIRRLDDELCRVVREGRNLVQNDAVRVHCRANGARIQHTDFEDTIIVHLYKRKDNPQVCDNNRSLSLLNITGTIFARIFANYLNEHLGQGLLPESQGGFRRHRTTTDMTFATCLLQAKCLEMLTHLYTNAVDLQQPWIRLIRLQAVPASDLPDVLQVDDADGSIVSGGDLSDLGVKDSSLGGGVLTAARIRIRQRLPRCFPKPRRPRPLPRIPRV
nr:unnamed protein product [Spirometra erinaceieuropaei]